MKIMSHGLVLLLSIPVVLLMVCVLVIKPPLNLYLFIAQSCFFGLQTYIFFALRRRRRKAALR